MEYFLLKGHLSFERPVLSLRLNPILLLFFLHLTPFVYSALFSWVLMTTFLSRNQISAVNCGGYMDEWVFPFVITNKNAFKTELRVFIWYIIFLWRLVHGPNKSAKTQKETRLIWSRNVGSLMSIPVSHSVGFTSHKEMFKEAYLKEESYWENVNKFRAQKV